MIPILYDSALVDALTISNGIGRLSDCINCTVTEERNGEYTMVMEYPLNGVHANDLTVNRIIKCKAGDKAGLQCFRIYSVSPALGGKRITVKCNHISYDLSFYPVTPFTSTVQLNGVATAFAVLFGHSVNPAAPWNLDPEWYDLSSATKFGTDVPTSVRSMLGGSEGSILDIFGGEYEFDNRTIRWRRERGSDNGVVITYGKNLTSYEQETNIAEVYCGILPYYTFDGTTVYGSVQYSDNASSFPFQKSIVKDFTNDFTAEEGEEQVAPTAEQLNERARAFISSNNVGAPKVSFDISFYPLWQDQDYKAIGGLDRVGLCDTVTVLFTDLGVRAKAKVVKTIYNALLERYESIGLGSVKANISDTIAGLMTSSGSASGTGSIGGNGVDHIVSEGTSGNWTYRKWFSGISECWGYYDVSSVACNNASGSLYVTNAISPNMAFPSGVFLSDSTLNCQMLFHSAQGTPAFVWVAANASPTVGATPFRLMRPTSTTISGRMEYSYKGRWK